MWALSSACRASLRLSARMSRLIRIRIRLLYMVISWYRHIDGLGSGPSINDTCGRRNGPALRIVEHDPPSPVRAAARDNGAGSAQLRAGAVRRGAVEVPVGMGERQLVAPQRLVDHARHVGPEGDDRCRGGPDLGETVRVGAARRDDDASVL